MISDVARSMLATAAAGWPSPSAQRRKASIGAFVAVLIAGCSDSFGPRDLAGAYTLQAINSQGGPWVLGGTAGSGVSVLDADTLTLRADGTFVDAQSVTQSGGYVNPGAFTHSVSSVQGTWSVRGSAITLTSNSAGLFGSGGLSGVVQSVRSFELSYTDGNFLPAHRTYARP